MPTEPQQVQSFGEFQKDLEKHLKEKNIKADPDGFIIEYLGLTQIIDRFTKDLKKIKNVPPLRDYEDNQAVALCSWYVVFQAEYTDDEEKNLRHIADKYGLPDHHVHRAIGIALTKKMIKIKDAN